MSSHIHTPHDGRGMRDVYLNGKLLQKVFYADTKKGLVRVHDDPLRLHKYRKRVIWRTKRGRVEVVPHREYVPRLTYRPLVGND